MEIESTSMTRKESKMQSFCRWCLVSVIMVASALGQNPGAPKDSGPIPYLKLSTPRHVLVTAQPWEANQFPHTMSVLEFNHDGYRYWGWYGLNDGGGVGLARSKDLKEWTKYEKNPLWTNARWPSVLAKADPKHPEVLYFAITRDYDTPTSYIVLASSTDGIHLKEEKVLVAGVASQRNQNPNLFRDPRSGRFYLTFYRGNDRDFFQIVSKSADSIFDLDKAPEKVLLKDSETIAAPTLLYLKNAKNAKGKKTGIYYMATEIYPQRYSTANEGEWLVKVFAAESPDGDFQPVQGNPIMSGQRACLFQQVFKNRFYGFDCHLESVQDNHWILEEVEAPLP
jgi:hypothetical protein